MGDVGFAKKSGKYHFFFSVSSVTCRSLTNDILYIDGTCFVFDCLMIFASCHV